MRKNLITIALISISILVHGQTNVGGPYFSNITWTKAGNPYTLTSDVQIPTGYVLTIEEGVEINFSGDYQILVKGSIKAKGSSILPIKFINQIGTGGKPMILFKNTNVELSELSRLEFNGGDSTRYGRCQALRIGDYMPSIPNSDKTTGELKIKDSKFTNVSVEVEGNDLDSSIVTFENNELIKTDVNVAGCFLFNLKNSKLDSCKLYNCIGNIFNTTITNSLFYLFNTNMELCKISNSYIFGSSRYAFPLVSISKSNLINSYVSCPNLPVVINSTVISNNFFNNNFVSAISLGVGEIECCEINGFGLDTAVTIVNYDKRLGGVTIKNTTFNNQLSVINNKDANSIKIDSCNFKGIVGKIIVNSSVYDVNASHNWWGTIDSLTIAYNIYDYYDNIERGIVNFSNKLKSEYVTTNCPDESPLITGLQNQMEYPTNSVQLDLYPNPTADVINFKVSNLDLPNKKMLIEVFNSTGQIVIENMVNIEEAQRLDVSHLVKGIYLFKVSSKDMVLSKKLVVGE